MFAEVLNPPLAIVAIEFSPMAGFWPSFILEVGNPPVFASNCLQAKEVAIFLLTSLSKFSNTQALTLRIELTSTNAKTSISDTIKTALIKRSKAHL